ncbi:MAG: 8-oxo-dGTP diphosphatase [Clostridia bacterium]|nr:8-oxo-dGTP diphosphatase [Clostridia bacterium]
MLLTTLGYIEKDGKYLMLHRTKKKNDMNKDKWLGIGGKFEEGESPEECMIRETEEETGLRLKSCNLRAVITFVSNIYEAEHMYLFTSDNFEGELIECNEGELKWVDKEEVISLNAWEGDKIFLQKLFNDDSFFTMKVEYNGDKMVNYKINEY